MNRCRVSFTDTNGIPHDVEVQAESLYEAVALAVAEFRADKMTAEVGPMTEFVIAIHRPAVEHRLRLSQVTQWAQVTREGPAGVIERQRIMSRSISSPDETVLYLTPSIGSMKGDQP
jgi:hypothetical protein